MTTAYQRNPNFLREISARGGPVDSAVQRAAVATQAEARRLVGVSGEHPRAAAQAGRQRADKSGDKLRPSIKIVDLGPSERQVGSDLPYAIYNHDDTRPHLIRPKNAKVLAFQGNTGTVFARVVHHPGTRGTKFLTRGAAAAGLTVTPAH